jgi:hypothetical protein
MLSQCLWYTDSTSLYGDTEIEGFSTEKKIKLFIKNVPIVPVNWLMLALGILLLLLS